ncbi:GMC family oxidoreductase [uncultured Pseudoteredinibacter sp.]|uniref:GMC family oxidoreductase n=1 Tax=uncultured Pseudoteredinibacter sp. TaxID=1641701 RepID=UPI00262896E8|nr:GMC family oxidoreductase [uncultured Pseudoteredinibacter sp.]
MSTIIQSDEVDVLVVGSGAAGSLFAATAAKAGKQVLVLEAGPEKKLSDLQSSQIWARKLKWAGSPVEESGNHKIGQNFNSGFGSGGSAVHHYGVWPRLHENDFNTQSQYGIGFDWPIQYDQLRPFYDRIQKHIGISGDAKAERWRPAADDYPMPALPTLNQGNVIAKGFKAKGLHTAPIPYAVNSVPKGNRQSCIFDGWCDAGCPTGALANPLVTTLAEAKLAGAIVLNNCLVRRVLLNEAGDKATGVEFQNSNGEIFVQKAQVVVLAAFTVQNARLLWLSQHSKHPQGLGNNHDLLGRYLMTHPAHTIWGVFIEETQPHMGLSGGQLICQDGYANKKAMPESYGSYQWLIANACKPNDLLGIATSRADLFGKKLDRFMQQASKHFGTMVGICDDIPSAENRITLSSNKDSSGLALAKAHHDIDPRVAKLTEHMVKEGLEIFKAAGASESWTGPRAGMHIMGGTIMGKTAKDSVCNKYGQLHDVANVFVAGPGLFPSSGAVNPTYTVTALSLMGAEHMLNSWSQLS